VEFCIVLSTQVKVGKDFVCLVGWEGKELQNSLTYYMIRLLMNNKTALKFLLHCKFTSHLLLV